MPRFRDLGFIPGTLPTGAHNAITDVAGVRVGHTTRIEGNRIRTGVTAILPHGDNLFQYKVPAAVHTINGFGKAAGFEQVRELGRIETPIVLTNTLCVGRAWDAVLSYLLRQNPDLQSVNPIIGECNDAYLNDVRLRAIREDDVFAAINEAREGMVEEGNSGAGTGTACYGYKGGIGTASRVAAGYTVGALLQTNYGRREELTILGVPVGQIAPFKPADAPKPGPGSVMIVLATDAPLTALELGRLARRAVHGVARTGSVTHHGSGDFVIAFSTQNYYMHTPAQPLEIIHRASDAVVDALFPAVVECVEEAVYNSLIAAETMTGRDNHMLAALPKEALVKLLSKKL
jgi:D-aminopeptidase